MKQVLPPVELAELTVCAIPLDPSVDRRTSKNL